MRGVLHPLGGLQCSDACTPSKDVDKMSTQASSSEWCVPCPLCGRQRSDACALCTRQGVLLQQYSTVKMDPVAHLTNLRAILGVLDAPTIYVPPPPSPVGAICSPPIRAT